MEECVYCSCWVECSVNVKFIWSIGKFNVSLLIIFWSEWSIHFTKNFFLFFFFWRWDWGLNSGLCVCKAVVLLEPHLSLFCSGYFENVVLRTICLGWAILPISASQVARITGMSHQCPLFLSILIPLHFRVTVETSCQFLQ
jgi:hypothetical protein